MADLVALEPLSESPDSVDENRGFSFKQRLVVVMDLGTQKAPAVLGRGDKCFYLFFVGGTRAG